MQGDGAQLLSRYPAAKVIVDCTKCTLRAQYDKLEMLEAGGDRRLTGLLTEIARRKGCTKIGNVDFYDRCGARYANMQPVMSEYQKAKGR